MTVREERVTSETSVVVQWDPKGEEPAAIETGVPFFDHMLEAMATHGGLGINVRATGDVEIDAHHLIEDVGIVLGRVLGRGRPEQPVRFGFAAVPMDEALVMVAVDFGGRGYLALDMELSPRSFGTFHTENFEDFLQALAQNAKMTVHVRMVSGHNAHHVLEAAWKALGIALGQAVAQRTDSASSTKGIVERPV